MYSSLLFGFKNKKIREIDEELKKQCYHCSKSTTFYKNEYIYHTLHTAFSSNDLNLAFELCNELIERNTIDTPYAQYWLYVIKGRILKEKKLYSEAIKSIYKAVSIGEAERIAHLRNAYALQGQVYFELKEYKKAITVLENWKSISKSNLNDSERHINLQNLGICYMLLKSYTKASKNLLESLAINQKQNDTLSIAKSNMNIGNLYYLQYMDSIAIPYFEKGLIYAKKAKDLKTLQNAYFNMAIVEENREQYKKALDYRKKYEIIKDSIWNRDKIWQLAEKDKALTVQLNKEKLASEKLKRNGALVFAGISLLGGVLVLFFWFQLKQKNKKIIIQKKQVDELNIEKDKLFTILSHDLKTPVYFLSNKLLSLITNDQKKDVSSVKEIQECYSIASNTGLLIENTLQWALNNRDKLLFKITTLHLKTIIDQVLYYYEPVIELKQLIINIHVPEFCSILGDNNTLKIVFRNIFDNAVKYTPKGSTIIINTLEYQEKITLTIKNPIPEDGESINTFASYDSSGLGHQLCEEFTKKNGGVFEVSSTSRQFKISLSLKKYYIDEYISI